LGEITELCEKKTLIIGKKTNGRDLAGSNFNQL
jgi:hypothetical protein